VHVPPLRERRTDVPLLAQHFLERMCDESGRKRKRFTPEALKALQSYPWPGNVRELKNVVERLVILTPGDVIDEADLPPVEGRRGSADAGDIDVWSKESLKEARSDFERAFILRKLRENDWNISKTAEVIGLERSNLHRKIKAFGIEVPGSRADTKGKSAAPGA